MPKAYHPLFFLHEIGREDPPPAAKKGPAGPAARRKSGMG
ncbi:hypothetical protein B4135_4118 [Caldibacillus debilis]|uniref:Uncharacterized protein n=1 Tax=Caldibacillus debilis TaxID=301148 RepID=A0A150L7U6_9BACI|nr:hypothetical protein B4135_4118 [Caldibacillus debilis]